MGNWIKEFRTNLGLSREQMAEILGVSCSLYDKIEYEQRQPSRNFMVKFKKKFPSIDMNNFFKGKSHEMSSFD